jgi:tetratricopeptide (TPR) repeat protein
MLITASDKSVEPLLKESVEAAEKLNESANERERRHISAARAWLNGNFYDSVRTYGDIAIDYPRDILALQVAHIGDFLLGQSSMLRDRIARALPHWTAQDRGFGYILGMYAFGLEETNLYDQAELHGNQALELNRRDPWAVHAVAHVMEMQGRQNEGIEWLESRQEDWAPDNMLAIHNWWHLALFRLDLDQTDKVLQLYDQRLRVNRSEMALDLVDASALMWRLRLQNLDTEERWRDIAAIWQARQADGYYAFNDVHALMAYLGSGETNGAKALVSAMEAAADGSGTNAMMTRDVGLPLARSLISFEHGDYEEVISQLQGLRLIAHRFGGSHAQRDLISLTLIEAALRKRAKKLAIALTAERFALKPKSRANRKLVERAATL